MQSDTFWVGASLIGFIGDGKYLSGEVNICDLSEHFVAMQCNDWQIGSGSRLLRRWQREPDRGEWEKEAVLVALRHSLALNVREIWAEAIICGQNVWLWWTQSLKHNFLLNKFCSTVPLLVLMTWDSQDNNSTEVQYFWIAWTLALNISPVFRQHWHPEFKQYDETRHRYVPKGYREPWQRKYGLGRRYSKNAPKVTVPLQDKVSEFQMPDTRYNKKKPLTGYAWKNNKEHGPGFNWLLKLKTISFIWSSSSFQMPLA